MSRRNDKLIAKIVREAYDRCMEAGGGHFDLDEVIRAVVAELHAHELDTNLIEEIAENAVAAEDKRRQAQSTSSQLNLLSEDDDCLDGTWRLGDRQRVRVGSANRDDYLRHLSLVDENATKVLQAAQKEHAQAAELLPYMTDAAVTITDAREAWRHDNDDGGDAS